MKTFAVPALLAVAVLLGACRDDDAATLLASGRAYLAQKNYPAAAIQLKNALQKEPDQPQARFLLGEALLAAGEPAAAAVELRKALALKHPAAEAVPVLARALLAQNESAKLVDEFGTQVLGTPLADADLQTSVAAAHLRLSRTEEARRALDSALRGVPDLPAARMLNARMLASQGRFEDALKQLADVLDAPGVDHEMWVLQGDLLVAARNRQDDAVAAYRKALASKPVLLEAHSALILLQLAGKDVPGARQQLEALQKVLPSHPRVRYFETLIAVEQNDLPAATRASAELMKVLPEDVEALQLAGTVALRSGALPAAQTHLAKALLIAPGNADVRQLLTRVLLLTGQRAEALATVGPLLDQRPADPHVTTLAAEAHLHNGNFQMAETLYARALTQQPDDGRSRAALALSRGLRTADGGSADELRRLAAANSGTAADYALISALLRQRDFGAALAAIDVLQKKQPGKPYAAMLRARVHLARGDTPAARKGFEQAVHVDAKYFPAHAALAALDLQAGQAPAARQRFETLLAQDPKNIQALLALAELRERAGDAPKDIAALVRKAIEADPQQPASRVKLVDHYLQRGDAKQAVGVAQDAVAAIGAQKDLLEAQGRAHIAAGDFQQAIASYNRIVRLQPQSEEPHLTLARAYRAMGNPAAAQQSLLKAVSVNPDALAAQEALLVSHLAAGRMAEAQAQARAFQQRRPADATGYVYEARVRAAQGQWPAAVAAYRTALKQAPSRGEIAAQLHAAMRAVPSVAEADRFATEWMAGHPQDAAFLFHAGDGALARNEAAAAETSYRRGLQIDPDNTAALNNLAWLLASQKKPQAVAFAQRATTLVPAKASYLDTLAMALAADRQVAKAIPVQERAVQLEPGDPALRLNLARLYAEGGDKARARTELDRLARLGNTFARQGEVGALLQQL